MVLAEEVIFPHPLSFAGGVLPHPLSLAVFPAHPLSLVAVVLPHESKAVDEVPAGAVKGLPFVELGTNDEDEVVGADDKDGNVFVMEGAVEVFPVEGVANDAKAFDEEVVVDGAVVDGVVDDHGSEVNPANPPIAELEDPIFAPLEALVAVAAPAPTPAPTPPEAPAPPKELVVLVLAQGSSKEEKFRPVAGEADPPIPIPIPIPVPMPTPPVELVVELVVGVNELSNCIPPTVEDFPCPSDPVEEDFPCPNDPVEDFPCPSDPVEEILPPCPNDPEEETFATP